jgi:photosystem II stability/assembly factor-like uncharacterized protein
MKRPAALITAGLMLATFIPIQLHAGWIRTYGKELCRDLGYYAQQTPDGGYIVTGFTASFSTAFAEDVWLLKTDSEGDTLWTRTYGGEDMDHGYCVQQTYEGGYIIVGFTRSFACFGNQDLWLLKTDFEGDTLWTRIYEGGYDNDEGSFVQQTTDGGYIIAGRRGTDLWLIKTDEAGDTLWTRTYDLTKEGLWNWGRCVRQTQDGGYIFTGTSLLPREGCDNPMLSLIKTDSNGDTLWTHLYGPEGSVCGLAGYGESVQQTPDRGYIVAGYMDFPEAYMEKTSTVTATWLLKTDEQGDTLWTRTYSRAASNHANCVDRTTDGGYILVGDAGGSTASDIWLVKTNANGDTLWTRAFGKENNTNSGMCVHQTSDRGYIITGYMHSGSIYQDDHNLCLIKTDSLGYLSVTEEPSVTHPSNWQIAASIGRQITLRYTNHPQGFHASVFDASGRKVDELHSADASGTITWPVTPPVTLATHPVTHPVTHPSPGAYFIRVESDKSGSAHKVVLMK